MAAHLFNNAAYRIARGELALHTADIRAKVVMDTTTVDTELDKTTLAGFTLIDEYDGAGYTEVDMAALAVVQDDTLNLAKCTATTPLVFGATVAAGTRPIHGILYYEYVDGTDANDKPVAFDGNPTEIPTNGNGGPLNYNINANGWLNI